MQNAREYQCGYVFYRSLSSRNLHLFVNFLLVFLIILLVLLIILLVFLIVLFLLRRQELTQDRVDLKANSCLIVVCPRSRKAKRASPRVRVDLCGVCLCVVLRSV